MLTCARLINSIKRNDVVGNWSCLCVSVTIESLHGVCVSEVDFTVLASSGVR